LDTHPRGYHCPKTTLGKRRPKDLDDARDVLATEDPENLEMSYIENWCAAHETTDRLEAALARIPPM
jgi:hypothetical protein